MNANVKIIPDVVGLHKEVKSGSDVVLSCIVTGITQAVNVVWKDSNHTSFTSNSSGSIIVDDGDFFDDHQTTTLTINGSVNTQDTTYTCEITSGEGGDPQPTIVYLYGFGKY